MDLVATALNAAVIATVGLVLAWLGKGQFQEIDRRFDAQDQHFDRLEHRLDGFQASLDAMRSDLTQVALAVGARRRAENA
jgi:hypothetical protein